MQKNQFSFDPCEKCALLGMTKLEKIPNEYNYQNMGGKIDQSLKYETNQVIIDITKPLFDVNNKDKIDEANVPMADIEGIKKGKEHFLANCIALKRESGIEIHELL